VPASGATAAHPASAPIAVMTARLDIVLLGS
jgi:hypothetical protein